MNKTKRNRIILSSYLAIIIGITALLTFFAGPRMMRMRHEVQNRQLLYKCQGVVNGDEIIVQLRSWERDHTNPLLTVKLVGVDAPPLGEEEDPAVIAYAEACGMQPAFASKMGKSSHHALLAFLRSL